MTECVARVIGLGQALATDDAVGLVVIERLKRCTLSSRVQLCAIAEASQLLELLCDVESVWIVDAVSAPHDVGCVLDLPIAALDARASCSASSHGLDVAQAIQLCRELYPERIAPQICILGIGIDPLSLRLCANAEHTGPLQHTAATNLSAAVALAVEQAAHRIELALGHMHPVQHPGQIHHARK